MKKTGCYLSLALVAVLAGAGQGKAATRCADVEVAGDNVWVAVGAELIKLDKTGGNQVRYVVDVDNANNQSSVVDIAVDAAGNVWAACGFAGVAHFDGSALTVAKPASGSRDYCSRVALAADGSPTVALGYGGFYSYAGGQWAKLYEYGGSDIYGGYTNNGLAFDPDGRLWWTASQSADGFGYCSAADGWHAVSRETAFATDFGGYLPTSLAVDDKGVKLIGVRGASFIKYDSDGTAGVAALPVSAAEAEKSLPVSDIQVTAGGKVMMAYGASIYSVVYTHAEGSAESIDLQLAADETVTCFCPDGERLFVGTSEGNLYVWDGSALNPLDISAGVGQVAADVDDVDAPTYDIIGRRVETTVPGSLYIKAGCKFIAR